MNASAHSTNNPPTEALSDTTQEDTERDGEQCVGIGSWLNDEGKCLWTLGLFLQEFLVYPKRELSIPRKLFVKISKIKVSESLIDPGDLINRFTKYTLMKQFKTLYSLFQRKLSLSINLIIIMCF